MSLKRKSDQLDASPTPASFTKEDGSSSALSPATGETIKYIKTEQLLNRTPSKSLVYAIHSPPNDPSERECFRVTYRVEERENSSWQMNKPAMDHRSLRLSSVMVIETNQSSHTRNRPHQHHPRMRITIHLPLLLKNSHRRPIPRFQRWKQSAATHLISINHNENPARMFHHRKASDPRSSPITSKLNRMFQLSHRFLSATPRIHRPPSAMRAWYSI